MNRFYHWLKSDQKYSEGVNLYVLHGQNEALKKMLLRGESPFGRRKLVQEITALSKGKVKVKEVAIVPPKPIPESDLPKEVQQLHKNSRYFTTRKWAGTERICLVRIKRLEKRPLLKS
jgi:hypothetical protein